MKSLNKPAAILAVLVVVALGLLSTGRHVSAASEGKVTGSIKLEGTAPHMRAIDMSKDPTCAKQHSTPAHLENVVVGSGGGLANVVVYISQGLPASAAAAVPSKPIDWDQKGCMYQPHVAGMDVGQQLKVINSDPTTHNIHPMPQPGGGNIGWNKSQPQGSPPFTTSWKAEEVAIPVKCNIHPWMHGYMVVVKGPYGVSDESGSFSLENVPPGSYTLTAWHETYGTQTQKVTVAAGKPATVNFTFKAK